MTAGSLLLVSTTYAALGPDAFQKGADGRLSLAVRWLFGPYLWGAALNRMFWKGDGRMQVPLCDGVSLGRLPAPSVAASYGTIVDLCAELPGRHGTSGYVALPMLDLATPVPDRLREAAATIEQARAAGTVLVCCALGYSRSAAAAATWLVVTGRADSPEAAIAQIRDARPHVVLDDSCHAAIAAAAAPAT